MHQNPQEFDLSNMDKYKDQTNYNVLGKMKSEVKYNMLVEWLALNPKCYSYRYLVDGKVKESQRAKGLSMPVVDKTIEFNDYHDVMTTAEPQTRQIYNIQSFNQQLFTTFEDKQALSPFMDKARLLDAINTEPY